MQIFNRTFEEHNLLDTVEKYEQAMEAALECLSIGNMDLAAIYLENGLSGFDIKEAHHIIEKIIN
jgi:hypothetical protein